MSKVVGEIVVDVTADVGPLVRQMSKAENAIGNVEGAANRMGQGMDRTGGKLSRFGGKLAILAAGAAAVAGGAVGLAGLAGRYAAFGDAIGDASKAAGMSTTAFQEYRFALKEAAAMTDEDFANAAVRLNKTLGEARQGSLAAVKAFDAIGISQAQLADASFNTDKAMAAYVATMEGMKDPAIAAAVSTDLFGRAGASMGAALSGVPGQVKSLVDRARELGVVLGPEAVEAAGKFDQEVNALKESIEVFTLKLADNLLPVLVDHVMPAIRDLVIPALERLGGVIKVVVKTIVFLYDEAKKAFEGLKNFTVNSIDAVIAKINLFQDKLQSIVDKAKEVGSAVANAFSFDGKSSMSTFQEDFGMGGAPGNNMMGGAGGAAGGQMLGAAIVNGAVMGAVNSLNENRAALAAVFEGITQVARDTLGINSPSKVFEQIGSNIGQGLAQGIASANAMVATSVNQMGAGAVTATNGMVSDVLSGLNTLLAGSQKGGAALAWINTLIGASQEIKKGTFGFASMARVLAQGAALVRGINGARGGRGSAAAGSRGPTAAATAAPPQQNVQTLNFTLQNDTFGIGQNLVRQIAAQLNEAQRNGSTLIRATVS
jgi:hypothetical protein